MLIDGAINELRLALGSILLISWLPLQAQQLATDTDDMSLLISKPQRCIALHQGQVCYQRIEVRWQAPTAADYCLFWAAEVQPLGCWQQQQQGHMIIEFASDGSRTLRLIERHSGALAAETRIEVAWVYKASTRRKTHWRLF